MAIILEANYSKKIGLPSYSSHQYAVTLRVELPDVGQVEKESARLYELLQQCVDREIQNVGYLPNENGNGNGNGGNGNGSWNCSEKQKELILKIVQDNNLDKNVIEALAKERFNVPVKTLNKLQASGFIEELLERYGEKRDGNGSRRGNGYRYRRPERSAR